MIVLVILKCGIDFSMDTERFVSMKVFDWNVRNFGNNDMVNSGTRAHIGSHEVRDATLVVFLTLLSIYLILVSVSVLCVVLKFCVIVFFGTNKSAAFYAS